MSTFNDRITSFFQAYEQVSNICDLDRLATQFAPEFILADPARHQLIRIDALLRAVPHRKALFDRLGCTATTLQSIQIHPITDLYALVNTSWQMNFSSAHGSNPKILVQSSFLISLAADEVRILAYLPHQDIMQTLRDKGILNSPQN